MDRFDEIQRLRDEYESALDEADQRRTAYHEQIRKLYLAGHSLAEIGDRLGISRQRVHEIIGNDASVRRRKKQRRTGLAVIVLLTVVSALGVWFGLNRPPRAVAYSLMRPSPPPLSPVPSWRYIALSNPTSGDIYGLISTSKDGNSMSFPKISGPILIEAMDVVRREFLHLPGPPIQNRPKTPITYTEVTADTLLTSLLRGNLTGFRIAGKHIEKIHRFPARLVGVSLVFASGGLSVWILTRRISRKRLVPVPA